MGFFDLSLKDMREKRNQKKLGEAIATHDVKPAKKLRDIEHFLAQGTKKIDYLRYYQGENGDMVPVGRYSDPVLLAQHVGLSKQGMDILAKYGLRPEGQQPAPVRGVAPPNR